MQLIIADAALALLLYSARTSGLRMQQVTSVDLASAARLTDRVLGGRFLTPTVRDRDSSKIVGLAVKKLPVDSSRAFNMVPSVFLVALSFSFAQVRRQPCSRRAPTARALRWTLLSIIPVSCAL